MKKTTGHVLKSSDVKLEGQFHLDAKQTAAGPAKKKNINSSASRVNIVENQSEFAVIEVTCCCGEKTHIKCEYQNARLDGQAPEQKK